MRNEEEIRAYFSKQGFNRFMQLLEKQYTNSKQGIRGYVTLTNIRIDERTAVDEFFGYYSVLREGETKRYSIKKFQQHLLQSRFEITVAELLEMLRGQPVFTKDEQEKIWLEHWNAMIRQAKEQASQCLAARGMKLSEQLMYWVNELSKNNAFGYRILKNVFTSSFEEAVNCLENCLVALQIIQSIARQKTIRLPILSAEVTGDAHAMDWKNPLGRLFWLGLLSKNELIEVDNIDLDEFEQVMNVKENNSQAIVIREGYRKGGISADDLSSQVMFFAPEWFGTYEERIYTLRQVEKLTLNDIAYLQYNSIYIVENPSVFAEIIDHMASLSFQDYEQNSAKTSVLICGNGQPTTAVLKLIDLFLSKSEKIVLHYAGDLDLAGVKIANGLWRRYNHAFKPWCMDKEIYLRYSGKGITITEVERDRLKESITDWNKSLIDSIMQKGVKLHQELWVEEIVQNYV